MTKLFWQIVVQFGQKGADKKERADTESFFRFYSALESCQKSAGAHKTVD